MKLKDEELNKVTGGKTVVYEEANLGQEIPSNAIDNYNGKNVYIVDRGNSKY